MNVTLYLVIIYISVLLNKAPKLGKKIKWLFQYSSDHDQPQHKEPDPKIISTKNMMGRLYISKIA